GSASATADGYASGRDNGLVPGHRFVVRLLPASVLVGRVVDADGGGVEGARVYAHGDFGHRGKPWTTTDASGRFRIDGLRPGRYQPVAETDTGFGIADAAADLGLGATSDELEIRLRPATVVQGTIVLGEDERPCTRGRVTLEDRARGLSRQGGPDPDGVVTLRGVLPGHYTVYVGCNDGLAPDRPPEVLDVADAPVTGLVWHLDEGRSIVGRVVDQAGRPVPRVDVRAAPLAAEGTKPSGRGARTDRDGRFRIRGLAPGSYAVFVRTSTVDTRDDAVEVDVPKGRDVEGVRLEFPDVGAVEGRLLDREGTPVGNVHVEIAGPNVRWNTLSRTTDDGAFRFEGLAPGTYRVFAKDPWQTSFVIFGGPSDEPEGVSVEVVAGRTAEVELRIDAARASIRGRVVGPGGEPIPDALVTVVREADGDDAERGTGWRMAQMHLTDGFAPPNLTDADGEFEVTGLTAGRYTVFATQRSGGEGYVEHVEAGSETEVVIEPMGAVAGTVRMAGTGAPERYTISIVDSGGTPVARSAFSHTSNFVVEDVPAGTYTVHLESDAGSGKAEGVVIEPDAVTDGVVVVVAGRGVVTGRYVDVETNEPVAGIATMHLGAGSALVFDTSTASGPHVSGDDGRFRLEGVPAGPARIVGFPVGAGIMEGHVGMTVQVVAGEQVDVGEIPVVHSRPDLDEASMGDLGFSVENAPGLFDRDDPPLRVATVRPGGPAATAGLRPGDVVVRVDGHDVTGSRRHLFVGLTTVPVGTKISLGLADGRTVTITAAPPP
ncbi:MAG: PDZ domain-containing protein, partial [Deltaproteobacteria bacterium]